MHSNVDKFDERSGSPPSNARIPPPSTRCLVQPFTLAERQSLPAFRFSSLFMNIALRCLACRRRKTKCDGVKPVCQRCARLGGECVYDPPERTPQTVRLQTRLRKLENELRSLSQRPSRISQRLQEYLSGEAQPRQRAVSPFIPLFPDGSSSSGTTGSRAAGSIVQLDLLDGYGTSLPRDELESALRMWDMQNAIPPVLSDYL